MPTITSIALTIILAAAVSGLFLLAPGSGLLSSQPELHETFHFSPYQETISPRPLPATPEISTTLQEAHTEVEKSATPTLLSSDVDLTVPFHSQAPLGNWSDPYQANGCEETSLLMASWYFNDELLTSQEAINEIHRVSDVAKTLFGEFRDVSTRDTFTLAKEVFPEFTYKLLLQPTIEQLKASIDRGKLIIVPVDGIVLKNPYYTPPGPEYHMLVLRGYNDSTKEFITNDPGTKRGEAIRYTYDNFMDAIGDYPTGFHEILPSDREKLVIIVNN